MRPEPLTRSRGRKPSYAPSGPRASSPEGPIFAARTLLYTLAQSARGACRRK
jgi:hypothetical protein